MMTCLNKVSLASPTSTMSDQALTKGLQELCRLVYLLLSDQLAYLSRRAIALLLVR